MTNKICCSVFCILLLSFFQCTDPYEVGHEEVVMQENKSSLNSALMSTSAITGLSFSATKEGDYKQKCFGSVSVSYNSSQYYITYFWKLYKNGVKILEPTGTSVVSFDITNQSNGSYQLQVTYILNPLVSNLSPLSGSQYSNSLNLGFGVPGIGSINEGNPWVFSGNTCAWVDGYKQPRYLLCDATNVPMATYNWSGGNSHINWSSTGNTNTYVRGFRTKSSANFPATFNISVRVSKFGYDDVVRTRSLRLLDCTYFD